MHLASQVSFGFWTNSFHSGSWHPQNWKNCFGHSAGLYISCSLGCCTFYFLYFIQVVTIIQKLLDWNDRNDNIGNYFACLAKSLLNTPTSYGKYVLILVVNFDLSISYILFFILYTVHKLRSWSSYYYIFRNQVEILKRAWYWYHIRFLLSAVSWNIFNTKKKINVRNFRAKLRSIHWAR